MSETSKRKAPAKKSAAKKAATPKRVARKAHPPEEKPVEAPEPKRTVPPTVPPPMARVLSRHLGAMHERDAKGYSFGELETAGLNVGLAKRMNVPIDLRRRSVLEGNVAALKSLRKPEVKKPKPVAAKPEKAANPAKKTAKHQKK
jgi:ribosomal protein L13E